MRRPRSVPVSAACHILKQLSLSVIALLASCGDGISCGKYEYIGDSVVLGSYTSLSWLVKMSRRALLRDFIVFVVTPATNSSDRYDLATWTARHTWGAQ